MGTDRIVANEAQAGQRLDRVMEDLAPELGLRGRRRLCAEGRVLVNGRPVKEAYKVKNGDVLEIVQALPDTPDKASADGSDVPRLVAASAHMAALYKPTGLHTVALAGKIGPSLEAALPDLLPGAEPRLLNRLDGPTSGLVLAALDAQSEAAWRLAQERGGTEKRYIALLEGALSQERVVRHWLKASGRPLSRRGEEHPDPKRRTVLTPLGVLTGEELAATLKKLAPEVSGEFPQAVTLAGCVIFKGARHQIRAHAAFAGFPLLGDARYGGKPLPDTQPDSYSAAQSAIHQVFQPLTQPNSLSAAQPSDQPIRQPGNDLGGRFFLHHGRVSWQDFTASCLPPWLDALPTAFQLLVRDWLR